MIVGWISKALPQWISWVNAMKRLNVLLPFILIMCIGGSVIAADLPTLTDRQTDLLNRYFANWYTTFGTDLAAVYAGTADAITLADNEKITFGTGSDVANYFDATDLVWDDGTNKLMELSDAGTTGSLSFTDNSSVVFGTGDDLVLYWDATDFIIDDSGGNELGKITDNGTTGTLTMSGDIVADNYNVGTSEIRVDTVELSNSEIKNLAATPKTLVAAQGANTIVEFISAVLILDYGSEVLTESDDDLVIEFEDGQDLTASIEATGFMDAAADTIAAYPLVAVATLAASAASNKAVQLLNDSGEYAGNASNDTTMTVKVSYRVHLDGL